MKYLEVDYIQKCLNVYTKGGTLFLLERMTDNAFCARVLREWRSNDPNTYHQQYEWRNNIDFFTVLFLTIEGAEEFLSVNKFMSGGCHYCGHGSAEMPIKITEHEFILYNDRPLIFEK